ncbi:MAG: LTA synthase family protein [Desulfovibrionaceae bacterium]
MRIQFSHFRYFPLCTFYSIYILLGIVLRSVLIFFTPEKGVFSSLITLMSSFVVGFFFDTITISYILFPWFLVITCIPFTSLSTVWYKKVTFFIALIQIFFILFVFVSEVVFWEEFTSRFNFIAVDYLIYTQEVVQNIVESYPLPLLLSLIAIIGVGLLFSIKNYLIPLCVEEKQSTRVAIPIIYCVFIISTSFIVNHNWKNFSQNTINNSLAGNGVYEFVAAFFNNELGYGQFYQSIALEEAANIVKKDIEEEGGIFTDDSALSFLHKRIAKGPQNNLNIILISVESLSSKYMAQFGEVRNITPFLDELSEKSLFFSNLYATGTRTVRGLEALTLSLPPTPGQSIVRRPQNEGLITMGSVLKDKGYETYFYYGGYGYFDNMNYYFGNNSYVVADRVIIPEEEIAFSNAWGVADESLYDSVIRSIDSRNSSDPFFYHVLTTSNHRPFTYPDGRIDIPSGEGRHGAVKYTDWALKDFFEKASKKEWFNNTIFVVVADHTAGGAGKTDLPLERYHIPMFIYSPKHIVARNFTTLTSQIDIVPTLLSILNVSYESTFMGYDVLNLSSIDKARAFIGTYQNLGYYSAVDSVLTILQPKFIVKQENANRSFAEQTPLLNKKEGDIKKAIAYYEYASYLFKNKLLKNEQIRSE